MFAVQCAAEQHHLHCPVASVCATAGHADLLNGDKCVVWGVLKVLITLDLNLYTGSPC